MVGGYQTKCLWIISVKQLVVVLALWAEVYHGSMRNHAVHILAVDLMDYFQAVAVLDLLTVVVTAVGAQD